MMGRDMIKALEEEAKGQISVLEEFSARRLGKARRGSIFVGAGDSYAAALAGFYGSGGSCIALDPYHLASSPEIADGVDVFLISVSGRTASNVAAASRIKGVARRTVAITSDEKSKLAGLVNSVIRLPISYEPRTPGLLSFSLSLLAVLKLIGVGQRCDFAGMLDSAVKDQGKIAWGKGTTYFLGNNLAYTVALYGAAKTYELLGLKAHPELLEEFSHLELFSLKTSDIVNIFSSFDPMDESGRLAEALSRGGYEALVIPTRGRSDIERVFHGVFLSQVSVLRRARDAGLSKPSFLSSKARLDASDSMIY
jgi:glutamine---fructose-6-phosphate transaminase (isomerizing)